jgi:hypothetical protein
MGVTNSTVSRKRLAAVLTPSALLTACCLLPSKQPPGIDRDKVATQVTELVRGMKWRTVTGVMSCTDEGKNKELSPKWMQVTVSMLDQGTSELNPTVSTVVPIGIATPSVGLDVKNQRGTQTDTVIIVDHLRDSATWPSIMNSARQGEADTLTSLVEKAERDLVTGGDSTKPCLAVSSVSISTIADLIQTLSGEIKIGLGPIVITDVKGNIARESKATMKFEIHYAGDPPQGAQQLLDAVLQQQTLLNDQLKLFQQQSIQPH